MIQTKKYHPDSILTIGNETFQWQKIPTYHSLLWDY